VKMPRRLRSLCTFYESAALEPVEWLVVTRELRQEIEVAERKLVARARAQGVTWDRIAEVLGVSRSAVIQRFAEERSRSE
jgi:hypothetical protein